MLQEFGSSKNLSYLPNPKGIRTADFIFERKGVYKLYDLKTIMGRSSVSNRLLESIGQANRVLLNMAVDYNPIALARNVKSYFEKNPKAVEGKIHKIKRVAKATPLKWAVSIKPYPHAGFYPDSQ